MVLILADMDRWDQDLYIDSKYIIIGPLLLKIYGGCNNPPEKICYKKQPE